MGLSVAQLPPLPPVSHDNRSTTTPTDFKVFASAKPSTLVVAKADSIDYFLADVMPTGAFDLDILMVDSMHSIDFFDLDTN